MSDARIALARAVPGVQRPLAPAVHRALVAQNARWATSPARDANLAALQSGASAVVTGQQVGLFLGPLYTLYKAASAIALARVLAADTGTPVVPVFWLQTEDHDLPEIATCGMPGETLAVPVDAANRCSIAHLGLPPEIASCTERLGALLGDGPDATAHLERLRRHYRAGATWGDAFAGVLAELFAPEGLVLLDPRDVPFGELAASIHAHAITQAGPIAAAMTARCDELAGQGKHVQVHVRPGAPLSFFHPEGAHGPRVRLEANPPREPLEQALQADPLQFSTSALLRPILQDTLLPTLAYVGGPAEVAYFAQLTPLYAAYDMQPPTVLRRASFRIVDDRTRARLDRLGLVPADAERPEAELLARVRRPGVTSDDVTERLLAPFLAAHDDLAGDLADRQLARTLDRSLARTRGSVERAIRNLAGKVERAALYADEELVGQVRRVRAILAPDGAPQERMLGLCAFAARFGDRALVERVLAAVDPFDPTLKELP